MVYRGGEVVNRRGEEPGTDGPTFVVDCEADYEDMEIDLDSDGPPPLEEESLDDGVVGQPTSSEESGKSELDDEDEESEMGGPEESEESEGPERSTGRRMWRLMIKSSTFSER